MGVTFGVPSPNLPLAPKEYERRYQDQFSNSLRLFFNSVTNKINSPLPHALYYDTTTQTNPVADAVNFITFNELISEFQVQRGVPTSKIFVTDKGVYNFQFSAQIDKVGGGKATVFIWPRVNGTNISDSTIKVVIAGSSDEVVATRNFVLVVGAGDYFEMAWQSSDTDVVLLAQSAASNYPGISSVNLAITWVSNDEATG